MIPPVSTHFQRSPHPALQAQSVSFASTHDLRFGKDEKPEVPPKTTPKNKSKIRKWIFRSLLGASLLGVGAGVYVRNQIPVVRSTEINQALSGPSYTQKSAQEKQELLWSAISQHPYKVLPATNSVGILAGENALEKFNNFVKVLDSGYMSNTFETAEDVRPPRDKIFHPFGAAAKVELVPAKTPHPFTGMFSQPVIGVARLSLAASEAEYAPGIALKLMVDGKPSVSIVAVPNLDPQTSRDFFEQTPTNIFPATDSTAFRVVNSILTRAADVEASNKLPVAHLSRILPHGDDVDNPVAPYQIEFRPAEVHFEPDTTNDFRAELGKIPAGTVIYQLWGRASEDSEDYFHIADVKTASPFVASAFADRELNFQHARK
jgi:hypothetical protein